MSYEIRRRSSRGRISRFESLGLRYGHGRSSENAACAKNRKRADKAPDPARRMNLRDPLEVHEAHEHTAEECARDAEPQCHEDPKLARIREGGSGNTANRDAHNDEKNEAHRLPSRAGTFRSKKPVSAF
jgi:hypothetical protein